MKPSYKTNDPKGHMGDMKRGASMGRAGYDTPAQALEAARTIAAGAKKAVDYFDDLIKADKVPSHLDSMADVLNLHAMRSNEYAADLARLATLESASPDCKVYLRHIPLDSGGYDVNGTYWGHSRVAGRIFWAASEDGIDMTFRAKDRAAAKAIVLESNPSKRFFK